MDVYIVLVYGYDRKPFQCKSFNNKVEAQNYAHDMFKYNPYAFRSIVLFVPWTTN